MATIPLWAVGKHVTAYVITPQSINLTTGVMTDVTGTATFGTTSVAWATLGSMRGHLEDVEVDQNVQTENIPTMDSMHANEVPIEFSTTYRLTELEKSAGFNKLAQLTNCGYNYYKIALTRGGQTWTGYGLLGNYKMIGNKRGIKASLEFKPVQVVDSTAVTANPSYV